MTRSFLFLLASTRRDGNTERLARLAAEGIDGDVRWLSLLDDPLPPFVDSRHDVDGVYPEPEGAARVAFEATLAATDVVIASPLYWYSVSASAKLYLDHWTAWMRVPGRDFRARMAGKTLWAVSAHSSEDLTRADPMIGTLRTTAEYMGMNWGGALLGYGNRPGDVLTDSGAIAQAGSFFTPAFSGADTR